MVNLPFIHRKNKKHEITKGRNRYFVLFCFVLVLLIIIQYYRLNNERTADITSPTTYNKEGLSFSYPGNWKIIEDKGQGDIRCIFIESPGNAVFVIQTCPNQEAIPLQQFAEQFPEIAQQETLFSSIGTSSFSDLEKSERSGGRYGVQEEFSSKALGIQRQYIRRYYFVTNDTQTAYLISQVATADLSKVKAGFGLILNSLLLK